MLEIEELRSANEIASWRQSWRKLTDQQGSDVFQSFEWVSTWLDAFWSDRPTALLAIAKGGEIVGLAPFLDDTRGQLWCRSSLVLPIHGQIRRTDLVYGVSPSEVIDAVLSHFEATRRSVKLAMLVSNSSPTYSVLPEIAASHRLSAYVRPESLSPGIQIDGKWESFFLSKSRHFRRRIRKKEKAIEKAGQVSIRIRTRPVDVERTLEAIFTVERHSWKAKRAQFISGDPTLVKFYTELARRAAELGWLRVHLLFFDSKPVAFIFGLVHDNKYYALKTSYDERYSQLSPGVVLVSHAIRDAFSQELQAFDFLGEDSRWKHQWATDFNPHSTICIAPRTRLQCAGCHFYHAQLKPSIKERFPGTARISKTVREHRIQAGRAVRDFFAGGSH